MNRLILLSFLTLGLAAAGCTSSDSGGTGGSGGTIGDLEWPPDATVYFDQYRVFNADCATDEDCAMALGYYHAFDRFAQMDIRRRFATGRFAGVLVKPLAESLTDDFANLRALFSTRDGEPSEEVLYEQATPKTKALLEAYSVGVNQWIADVRAGRNDAVFPREFQHPLLDYTAADIPEWRPQDCVAAVLALVENLTNEESVQLNAAIARAEIGDDNKFSDLWARRPLEESSILPLDWTPAPPPSAALSTPPAPRHLDPDVQPSMKRLQKKLASVSVLRELLWGPSISGDDDEIGSNNWVIGPTRTIDGTALLANDPHLGMTQPATWYVAHLDAVTNGLGEIHTAGMSFAGLPWVIVGQNERIAWGVTTTNMDFSDIYVETLTDDGNGVVFNGEDVPFITAPFTIEFSDGTTEERELLFVPHHGAVRELDTEAGTALTLRWTGSDLDTDINVLTDLARAATAEEARTALEGVTSIGQNWVVIDSENNIGWYPYNRLPKRTWATNIRGDAPAWLPLDGGGDYEWDTYFALEELPQATNPESGYIATANNDMTGALFDEDPTTLPSGQGQPPYQSDVAAGFRHSQIVKLIDSVGDMHSRETMDAIISDVYSLIGERMTPGMLAIANDDQVLPGVNGPKVISALENWNYTCPSGVDGPKSNDPLVADDATLLESSGCTAFHILLIELRARIEQNENAPDGRKPSIATYYSIVDPSRLIAGDVYWDDPATQEVETKFQVMSDALNAAGDFLDGELGADETEWAWGRLHGLLLQSDLSSLSAIFAEFDNPPPDEPLWANDGGLFTVDVANPGQTDPVQLAGASTRFVCEASPDGPSCTFQLPGGQSSDINSPYYEDLVFPYLENTPFELVFDLDTARDNAENGGEIVTFE